MNRMDHKDRIFLGKKQELIENTEPQLSTYIHLQLEGIEDKHRKMVQELFWNGDPVEMTLNPEQVATLVAIDEYVAAVTSLAIRLATYNGVAELLGEKKTK